MQTVTPFVVEHVLLSATAQPGVPAARVIATLAVFVDVSTRPFETAAPTYASKRLKSKTPFCCSIRCHAKSPCAIVPVGTAGASFALTIATPKNSGGSCVPDWASPGAAAVTIASSDHGRADLIAFLTIAVLLCLYCEGGSGAMADGRGGAARVNVLARNVRLPRSQPFMKRTVPEADVCPAATPGDTNDG